MNKYKLLRVNFILYFFFQIMDFGIFHKSIKYSFDRHFQSFKNAIFQSEGFLQYLNDTL